jgi:hypothetical protein
MGHIAKQAIADYSGYFYPKIFRKLKYIFIQYNDIGFKEHVIGSLKAYPLSTTASIKYRQIRP